MLWAACCTRLFFGFLYSGEFTCHHQRQPLVCVISFSCCSGCHLNARDPNASRSLQMYFGGCSGCGPAHLCLAIGLCYVQHVAQGSTVSCTLGSSLAHHASAATFGHVLSGSDVAVDSHSNPSFASVCSRHSKMDIFGVGTTVFLGWLDGLVCPVKAILAYLAL